MLPGCTADTVEVDRRRRHRGQAAVAAIDVTAGLPSAATTRHPPPALGAAQVLGDHVKQAGLAGSVPTVCASTSPTTGWSAPTRSVASRTSPTRDPRQRSVPPLRDHHGRGPLGAIAFFGDKYGDVVRVLEAGPTPPSCAEGPTCGPRDIGLLKVVRDLDRLQHPAASRRSPAPVRSSVTVDRRTGCAAAGLLESPSTTCRAISRRGRRAEASRDELKVLRRQLAGNQAEDLARSAVDGVVVARADAESRDEVRDLAVALQDRPGIRAVVLGSAPRPEARAWPWSPRSAPTAG